MRPVQLPGTPLEKLTELPHPLAGIQKADSRQGRGGKGRVRERSRKREGVAFPHFFFYNLGPNDCSAVIVAATYTWSLDLALQLVCSSVCCHHAD